MPITKPYRRIIRPFALPNIYTVGLYDDLNYIASPFYADDRYEIIRAYHVLERDLVRLFDYVEPANGNLTTYSYRLYELLLRAATEFESNATKILQANHYSRTGNWNITDYYKINTATKLHEYEVFINVWSTGMKMLTPLAEWSTGHQLSWYQKYNEVKHDRKTKFDCASLENVLNAVASVFCIVFAQFHNLTFTEYQPTQGYGDGPNGEIYSPTMLFSIKLPQSWTPADFYDFQWPALRSQGQLAFQDYPFSL